jgi:transcriptional regulator GlxA family with amidase domain
MADHRLVLGVVLFPDFELLDVYGPLEVLGHLKDAFRILMVGPDREPVASIQGPRSVVDHGRADAPALDMVLVPGGLGTRREVENESLLGWLQERAADATYVASVCTGAALLARAGLLDGRRATSNKRAWDWVVSQGPKVAWVRRARWIEDAKFWTSSGVSAGIDMTLRLVATRLGQDAAEDAAWRIEYAWHRDASVDPFVDPRPARSDG